MIHSWWYELPPGSDFTIRIHQHIVLIGSKSRSLSIIRDLIFITGMPTQIPQWSHHQLDEAYAFPDSLKQYSIPRDSIPSKQSKIMDDWLVYGWSLTFITSYLCKLHYLLTYHDHNYKYSSGGYEAAHVCLKFAVCETFTIIQMLSHIFSNLDVYAIQRPVDTLIL